MRTASDKCVEATQRQSTVCLRPKEAKSKNTVRLTQSELEAWWPFERLDPKRFPKPAPAQDIEDAPL
mgnify:CR=1 FL=1